MAIAERARNGHGDAHLVSCPVCGASLNVNEGDEARVLHAKWHERISDLMVANLGKRREPSAPAFDAGDIVFLPLEQKHGKVLDRWTEKGPLHCYTLRIDGCRLLDVIQDELVPI